MKTRAMLLILFGLLIVIVPLFLNTATDTEFTFNKTFLFQLGILLIISGICFVNKFSVVHIWRNYKVIVALFVSYLFILILVTLFSQSPYVSFFGPGRLQGLLQYLFYFALAFITFILVVKVSHIQKLIYWIVAGSAVVSIVGIMEQLGFRIFKYTILDYGIASTLGHPSFLGGYLVMTIPLTVAIIFFTASMIKKWVAILLTLLQILVLYFTYTRGAWIALIAVAIFSTIIMLVKLKKKKVLYSIIGIMMVVGGFLVGTGLIQIVADYQSGSGALRVLWAEEAYDAIKERPWLGYGLETQKDVLIRYYNPLQGVYGYYNDFADRVHNEFLDSALTTGLIGLLAYLSILIYTFIRAIRFFLNSKNTNGSVMVFALTAGLFAYIVQGMFSFSVTVLSVYLWLYIALIFIIIRLENNESIPEENVLSSRNKIINRSLGLVFIILIGVITVRPIIADDNLRDMTKIDVNQRFAFYEIQDIHDSILPYAKNSSAEIAYRFRYVDLLMQVAAVQEDNEKKTVLYALAEDELAIIKVKNPEDINYDFKMGNLMNEWGRIDKSKFDVMNQAYQAATLKSPNYALTYFFWGKGLEDEGLLIDAREQYLIALGLFADPDSSGITSEVKEHLTLTIASVYIRLSAVERELGSADLADKYENKKQELIAPYLNQ
ncbi:MAG: O-antigen ligase family protein [Patescibacteria group bacterium]|jgi:putative inorganic carbon (HCO3(-)) transporter